MPIKVLHALNMLGPKAGGPTRVIIDLTRAQANLGYEITVISTDRDLPSKTLVDEIEVRAQFDSTVEVLLFPVDFVPLLVSPKMGRWLRSNVSKFDIVHVHGCYRYPTTMTARIARLSGVPYIIRPHVNFDTFLFNKSSRSVLLKRVYEKLFDFPNFRKAAGIHCTANEELKVVNRLNFGAPGFVLPNGVDWSSYEHLPERGAFRARLGVPETAPLILFLGRINFKKGLDLLIPAFAQLSRRYPSAKLVIAGPDNEGYGALVRAMIETESIRHAVIFTGPIYGQDIQVAYQDGDLFVLPSYGENFGMSVIEAMACGTPVLISDQVNIFEDVVASGAGIAVPCQVQPLAAAMLELMDDEARRAAMASRARPWIKAHYVWSSIARGLDERYRTAMRQQGMSLHGA